MRADRAEQQRVTEVAAANTTANAHADCLVAEANARVAQAEERREDAIALAAEADARAKEAYARSDRITNAFNTLGQFGIRMLENTKAQNSNRVEDVSRFLTENRDQIVYRNKRIRELNTRVKFFTIEGPGQHIDKRIRDSENNEEPLRAVGKRIVARATDKAKQEITRDARAFVGRVRERCEREDKVGCDESPLRKRMKC